MYKRKRIVVALGGNALGNTLPEQMIAVKSTAKARFRRCGGFGAGLAYLPPERPLRGTRADEAARRAPASPYRTLSASSA